MAKFKVGDKVNCANYGNGVITKIITSVMPEIPYYVVFESGKELYLGADRLTLPVVREFIVINRSGNVMTAEHRVNREVIKSAKATCAPSDTFDFDTGAKLAFDRLMGREEPKPAPQPAHRFKVGDRVVHEKYGIGTIIGYLDLVPSVPYLVEPDNGNCFMNHWAEAAVSPAPAPYISKVGDRVVTEFGNGTVVKINTGCNNELTAVMHDDWSKGHNGNQYCKELSLQGNRCYFVHDHEIRPLTGYDNVH